MYCKAIQRMMRYVQRVPSTDADIAVDAIAEVGPHGHIFGADHTQSRYDTAFKAPFLSDWRN